MEIETMLDLYWKVVHATTVGQVIFVVMWFSLPWWRSWVGRALMVKSFAFMVILLVQLYFYHTEPMDRERTLQIALAVFSLVLIGVWGQVVALGHEIYVARQARRQISGIEKVH